MSNAKRRNGILNMFDVVDSMVEGGVGGHIGEDGKWVFTYEEGQEPLSESEIDAEVARLEAEYDALEYSRDRAVEYPSMADQLDYIYHNGIAKWKSDMVKPVKDAHPKPE